MSGNFPGYLETWKPAKLQTFQTAHAISGLSANFPDVLETVRLYGNLPDVLEDIQDVWKISRLSGNLPDFLEDVQVLW